MPPIEKLERHNAWYSSLGSSEPAGSYTLVAQRTKYGIVSHRGTVAGKPVLFTKNRSTYGNEAGSALGFMLFNDPDAIHSAADFKTAASNIGYTFNWFYTDKTDIAYFNSGDNPVRAAGRSEPADLGHVRMAGLEPGHEPGDVHAGCSAPSGGQPGLPDHLEQ